MFGDRDKTPSMPTLTETSDTSWQRACRFERRATRSEEHTSELQSLAYLVCRLLLEKKKKTIIFHMRIHICTPPSLSTLVQLTRIRSRISPALTTLLPASCRILPTCRHNTALSTVTTQ